MMSDVCCSFVSLPPIFRRGSDGVLKETRHIMSRSPKRPSVLRTLLHLLLRRRARSMQQQTEQRESLSHRPMDQTAWAAYWKQQGQPWRTEPEIEQSRQEYLAARRSLTPDVAQGSYP